MRVSVYTMEGLNELLQECNKNALVGIVQSLCVLFQRILTYYLFEEHYHENDGTLNSEVVLKIVRKALRKMTNAPVEGVAPVLDGLVQRCDKNALVGVVESLCAMFEEKYLEPLWEDPQENDGVLDSEAVKAVVHRALVGMQVVAKR